MSDAKPKDKSKNKNSKSIVDVAHPGTSAAEPAAKPVIISNRPMVQDPMVVGDEGSEMIPVKVNTGLKVKKSGGNRIEPLSAPELPGDVKEDKDKSDDQLEEVKSEQEKTALMPDLPAEITKAEPEDKKIDDTLSPETEDKPETPALNDEAPKQEPVSEEIAKTDEPETKLEPPLTESEAGKDQSGNEEKTPRAQGQSANEAEDEAAARQAEHDKEIQKLVDAKQFYLPVNAVEKRRTKRAVLLGLIVCLLLILVWLDIALDAGLITINGVKPLTHFFSG